MTCHLWVRLPLFILISSSFHYLIYFDLFVGFSLVTHIYEIFIAFTALLYISMFINKTNFGICPSVLRKLSEVFLFV